MDEIFQRRKAKTLGAPLGTILRRRSVKGEVALEIEVEGANLLHAEEEGDLVLQGWRYHIDGSLRGEENAEYVSDGPVAFNKIEGELERLWNAFRQNGARLDDSNRTSVHVHLNCQPLYLDQFTAFACAYFALEEILTEWCGEHRVGNLFCLRGRDAPGIISNIQKFIVNDGDWTFSDGLHYAAFNPQALNKFGSIEIRTMRGTPDKDEILHWVQILQRIYEFGKGAKDPREVVQAFSAGGPMHFFETILGDKSDFLRKELGLGDAFIRDSLYSGIRLAQKLCYCRDWSKYERAEIKPDPFGRSIGEVVESLNSMVLTGASPSSEPSFLSPTSVTTEVWQDFEIYIEH